MKKVAFIAVTSVILSVGLKGQQVKYLSNRVLAKHQIGEIILQPVTFKDYQAETGILIVKENWFEKNSKTIQLKVMRVFSKNEQKKEPLFYFTGGPGVSNINEQWIDDWMLEDHDVILVGYRGLDSDYTLRSKRLDAILRNEKNLMSETGKQKMARAIDQEIANREKRGRDISGYSVLNVIEDIEATRKAFRYDKIDLIGLSYGGAIVELYAVKYQENINKEILISPATFYNIAYSAPDTDSNEKVWKGGLSNINEEWKKDSLCLTKSKDIEQTIENVKKMLPQKYAGIYIAADRLEFMTHAMLYDQSTVAQCLDAYLAAEKGDFSGLAYMVFMLKMITSYMNIFDLCYKTYTSHIESFKYEQPKVTVFNTSEFAWGTYQYIYHKIPFIPDSLSKKRSLDVKTLIIIGETDGGEPWAKFHGAFFKEPDLVVLDNMGHQDMFTIQREGYIHLARTYLLEGVADTSKYKPVELKKFNFIPTSTFQEIGKKYKKNIMMRMTYSLMFLKMRLF